MGFGKFPAPTPALPSSPVLTHVFTAITVVLSGTTLLSAQSEIDPGIEIEIESGGELLVIS